MLAPDTLGSDLLSLGQEVIIHLACKDWNRNALESRGWKLGSEGFRNVLCLSGDYPVTGHKGHAAPVFDIDSVGLIGMFAEMNAGLRDERRPEPRARSHRLLPRVRRDEPQAARAGGDAAVPQAEEEGRGRRAVRHQPDRLRHAQGRRAAALDPAGGAAGRGARERVRALAGGRACVPPRRDPGRDRDRRAARARRAPGRLPGQGTGRSSSTSRRGTSPSRAGSASPGCTSAGTCRPRRSTRSSTRPTGTRATTGSRSRARSSSRSRASSTSSSATPRPGSPRTSSARPTSSRSAAGRPTCACP